jgi:hypothetical protein
MKYMVIFICLLSTAGAYAKSDEHQIRDMLSLQVKEWNKGNIEGYMVGYWQSDSLVFIGKNGPTYGYTATLDRYKKSYPDRAAMGILQSTVLSLKKLSAEYYFVIGKWELERKAGNLTGSYTLLVRKIRGVWVIINDHSS